MKGENPYQPWLAKIIDITLEASGERAIRTFKLEFQDEEVKKNFTFKPGQFIMISVFGVGESTFAISSSPTQKGYIEVSAMRYGKVTKALHQKEIGDTVGARGNVSLNNAPSCNASKYGMSVPSASSHVIVPGNPTPTEPVNEPPILKAKSTAYEIHTPPLI